MSKYQYSKLVMEKYLRRSFYDAVLELYEAAQGARIISVSLEGTLSLVVNKDDNFHIKLNEIAQRADDREEHHRYKGIESMKLEGVDHYVVKKEEPFIPTAIQTSLSSEHEAIPIELCQKDWGKGMVENNQGHRVGKTIADEVKGIKVNEVVQDKIVTEQQLENDTAFEKSSEADSDSEEDADLLVPTSHYQQVVMDAVMPNSNKSEMQGMCSDEVSFVAEGHMDDHKMRLDKESDHRDALGKKSPRKRRKTSIDGDEELSRTADSDRVGDEASTSAGIDDGANSGLQLLPHTATGPIIVEEDENYSGGQMAQLAMLQMRESNLNMFRQQDLEELARQQQQWQMVAYQRSFMEKSYLQHQMQQYQRDTERLRWEYAAVQQARDYPQGGEEAEKLYRRQTSQTQNSGTEAALLAAAALEEAKKTSRDANGELTSLGTEKISSQYLRVLSDDTASLTPKETEYEEGELRPETHNCALCNTKFSSMDFLLRHMEKHRVAFERSCSVCQSGTLTGNMLILHMEASHGPESSFSLPSSTPSTTMSSTMSTNLVSAMTDYSQSFSQATHSYTPTSMETSNGKSSHQGTSPKQVPFKEDVHPDSITEGLQNLNYHLAAVSSHPSSSVPLQATSSSSESSQENFLGIHPPQFYPLIGCQICGEKFALSEALDQHVESQHKEMPCSYSCKPCSVTFDKHADLAKHMSRHETASSNLKCSHCLKSFKSVKQLRLHYVAAHACCHFCEYCRAGFPDAMALQVHEQLHTLDPEKLSYRCDICNKAFYTQSQCSAHKRTHKDEKAHACELCGSAFFKRGDLTKHVRTVHSPSRLFACKFCGKKGTRMDNMRSHVRSHHKNMTRDQIINMIEVIE